jgi:signal transduction histidine kinase/CheY-like chemotaxis protein
MLQWIGRPNLLALSSMAGFKGILGTVGLLAAIGLLLNRVACARTLRQSATQANAAKAEFLANMSHEIRTPLNGIVGVAEMLAMTPLSDEQRELMAVIERSSEALLRIVNDIFDFSRMESGNVVLDLAGFDVRALVGAMAESFTPRASAKGLAIHWSVSAELPAVLMGDLARIRQVLEILVDNAVKFTHAGAVRIEVTRTGDCAGGYGVLYRVADTGIGVQMRLVERIFRPFAQADTSAARCYGGTGLGLAISHRLVTLMGGAIDVESRPGHGSTFWFLLPLTEDGLPAAPADGPKRILVVDDNPVNQLVATRAVGKLGYLAEAAGGGEEAVRASEGSQFDAVLMDCQMPVLDGYQATAYIRRREAQRGARRLPIIAMTANVTDGDPERCRAAGMDDYLPKPLKIAALSAALERWTGESAIMVRGGDPAPAGTTPPGLPNGRSPIPPRGVRPRGGNPIFAGWRSYAYSLYRSGSRCDEVTSHRTGNPTGAGNRG